MARAIELAHGVRRRTAPNPWVGAVLRLADGRVFEGATAPPGGPHAEVSALDGAARAGVGREQLTGAMLCVTMEPCSHHGRTPPCAEAIATAGVGRVVVGIEDPDPQVSGRGLARLREAGVAVSVGVRAEEVAARLAPYLTHRRTGRPFVTLKLATTLDGRTAAPDGSSRWITSAAARADAHRLRAEHDAVLVGAGTVRADDPQLTVREVEGPDPVRVVLGRAPVDARVRPCLEMGGELGGVLDELGARGLLSVLVEGGATVAHAFHTQGLVDRYLLYLAPVLLGGEGGAGLFRGAGARSIDEAWRGRLVDVTRIGPDLRVELAAGAPATPVAAGAGATPVVAA